MDHPISRNEWTNQLPAVEAQGEESPWRYRYMPSAWVTSSLLLALIVYVHATYRQKSHGPVRSLWFKHSRSPFRCALYVLIGGIFGAVEYVVLCLLSRRPSISMQTQLTASSHVEDDSVTREYWDKKFQEGLEANQQHDR